MMGLSPRCYIPNFVKDSPPVVEKKIFEGFLPYNYGRGCHLGNVTQMPRRKFRSPYPRRLHIKFGFDGQAVSEKKMFEYYGRRTDDRRRRRRTTTDAGPWVYYKLTNEPLAQVS